MNPTYGTTRKVLKRSGCRGGACPLVALFLVAGGSPLLLLARGDAALLGEARRAVGLIVGDGHDHRGRIRIRPWGQGQRRPLQLAVRRLSPCRLATQGTQEPQGGT